MGVIAACIPSLRPLISMLWKGTHQGPSVMSRTLKNAQATTSSGSSRMIWPGRKEDGDKVSGFTRLEDPMPAGGRYGHGNDIHGGRRTGGADDVSLEEIHPPETGIRVKNVVVVTSESWEYKDRLF